jgi:hypothetical protein
VRAAVDGPTTPVRRGYAAGMDIIGNGAPADRPHGRDVPRERDAEAHLDLDAEPGPVAAPARGRLLPDLLSAESLAVGALVLGAGTLFGGSWMQFLLFGNYDGTAPGPQEQYLRAAVLSGVPAALTLVLGLGALARRRADGPP